MLRVRFLATIVLLLLLICGCTPPPDTALVTEVIDGDTIVIEGGYRVRYIGIDTPEIRDGLEPFGMQALEANRQLVEGKRVRLERDVSQTDKYERLLRYVYVDNIFVNAELVRLGLAEAKAYPPDTKYQEELEELEREAKQAGRGMWAK
jgi:micrococcal nuclease